MLVASWVVLVVWGGLATLSSLDCGGDLTNVTITAGVGGAGGDSGVANGGAGGDGGTTIVTAIDDVVGGTVVITGGNGGVGGSGVGAGKRWCWWCWNGYRYG